jgi:hypothetical protein
MITVTPTTLTGLNLQSGSLYYRNINISSNTGGTVAIEIWTGGGNWLGVDKTSTTKAADIVQVSISTANLAPGNYPGAVRFSSISGSPALPKTVPIGFTIAAPSNITVTTNPSPVSYSDNVGSTAAKVATATIANSGPATTYTVTKNAAWVSLSKTSGSLGQDGSDSFSVTLNPTGLVSGTYSDIVTVVAASGVSRTFTVTLTMSGTGFSVSPQSLSFTAQTNTTAPTAAQVLTLTNSGAALSYTVSKSSSWLSVSKSSGSIGANGTDTFSATASPAGLEVGTYQDTITISAPGRSTLTVNVTFSVTGGIITFSPSSVAVSLARGSSTTRSINLNFSGNSATLAIEPSSSAPWLSVNKSSTTLGVTSPNDVIQATINTANLNAGQFAGSIRVSSLGPSPALPKAVDVIVTVTDSADLTAQPSQVSFNGTAGSSVSSPGLQTITVTNSGAAVTYSIGKTVPWIQLSKTSGSLATNGSDTFNLSPDINSLAVGTSSGQVIVSAAGRPDRAISVTVNVSPKGDAQTLTLLPSKITLFADPGQTPVPQLVYASVSGTSAETVNLIPSSPSSWLQTSSASFQASGAFGVTATPTSVSLPSNGEVQLAPASSAVASASLPVTLMSPGSPVYTIPRVADGNFFATTITIVNRDTVPATVSLTFFKENGSGGTGPWAPDMEGNTPLTNVTIPVGASFTWQTRGVGTVGENGWALASCNQKISGFAIFRQTRPNTPSQEAAVPINSGWQQRFLLPFDNIGNVTAVALSNVSSSESASITAIFKDEQGQPIAGTFTRTLPPLGHIAFTLPSELAFLAGRRGTAEFFTTNGRVSSLGLRFSTVSPAFTSFEPQSLNVPVTGSLTIPQVADGDGGGFAFTTAITIVNNDIVPARVSLRFFQRNPDLTTTRPWTPSMQNNTPIDNVEIRAGASFTWRTTGTDPFAQGWAEVQASGRVSGFAIFQQRVPGRSDQEAAVPVNAGAQQRFLLPFDNTDKFATTMALANFSSTDAGVINVVFRDSQNATITSAQITLPARGHDSFSLFERFPALKGLRGVAEFTALGGQITPLGLRFSDIAFTSFRTQVF